MPGPKMGARPADFDEELVRQAPTFAKWTKLESGQKLRYACRDFIKGHGDDEERLMRRIMIARRNNLRDHETLKRARQTKRSLSDADPVAAEEEVLVVKKEKKARRSNPGGMSDTQVLREMDVPAVEATRSYRQWAALEDGKEFTYNQKYIKGKDGHDWLLRKNIWRRMRYRRENKKMVERLKAGADAAGATADSNMTAAAATHIVDHALLASAAAAATTTTGTAAEDAQAAGLKSEDATSTAAAAAGSHEFVPTAVVEAAVAAAASYVKEQTTTEDADVESNLSTIAAMSVPSTNDLRVHNPLEAAASNEALDAAAKLAAAAAPPPTIDDQEDSTSATGIALV